MQTDKKSFLIYYMSKFGGKRDPSLLVEMIEALKEWLPTEIELGVFEDEYCDGWNAYHNQIMENLK